MRYVDMALDLTEDQFDRLANDPWFRDTLIADIETGKVRVDPGGALGWWDCFSDLAARLGWVVDQDESGYYALPVQAADLRRRVEVSEARATAVQRALGSPPAA